MPTDSRAQVASISDEAGATLPHRDGVCAAGQAQVIYAGAGLPGDRSFKKPIADEDREALRRLVEAGKAIRRSDGRYGTAAKPMMTGAIAARLKARSLAVSAFDNLTMYPSDKGKRLYAEMKNGAD